MESVKSEGVYLVHTRELIALKEIIYKIGRSHDLDNRVRHYPKKSKIMFMMNCENSVLCESELIKIFKNKFIQKLDYGTEYFEGDKELMIKEIFNFITNRENFKKKDKKDKKDKKVKKVKKDGVVVTDVVPVIPDVVEPIIVHDVVVKKINNKIVIKDQLRTCPECNYIFEYPSRLKKHFSNTIHCKKTDNEIEEYFLNIKHNSLLIKCNICDKEFSRKDSLNRHQKESKCCKSKN